MILVAAPVLAAPGPFTDVAEFQAEISTAAIDFEALASGTDVSGSVQSVSGVDVVLPGPVLDVLDATGPALPLTIVEDAVSSPAASGTKSLGVQDPNNFHAFSVASLELGGAAPTGGFLFNVDDLLVPVPEPSGAAAFVAGIALLSQLRARREVRSAA